MEIIMKLAPDQEGALKPAKSVMDEILEQLKSD